MKRLKFWPSICILTVIVTLFLGGCFSGGYSASQPEPTGSQAGYEEQSSDAAAVTGDDVSQSGLLVHFIDVGQGDSILIQQNDHSMLIDAGENDQGQTVVSYLKSQGIDHLDYIIGTHPHSDHIGGLDDVILAFETDRLFLPPVEHTTTTFEDVLDAAEEKGLSLTMPQVGDIWDLGDASFTILSPNGDYGEDLNNWSIGIRLEYGENHFVLCGDAEAQAESDICSSGLPLKADVLKAGHHGSSTSTSDQFLDQVDPTWVVIQCGKDNFYGHPHKETLEKLEARGIDVLRTDLEGTIVAASNGTDITWSLGGSGPITADENETWSSETADSWAQEENYILNTSTKKFHRPDCPSVAQMRSENRQEYTGNREALIQEGYSPCKQCSP